MEIYPPGFSVEMYQQIDRLNAALAAHPFHNGGTNCSTAFMVVTYYERDGIMTPEGAYISHDGIKRRYPTSIVDSLMSQHKEIDAGQWQASSSQIIRMVDALARVLAPGLGSAYCHTLLALLNQGADLPPIAYCDGVLWDQPFNAFIARVLEIFRSEARRELAILSRP